EEWIIKAQRGEYPFELAETLACAFGRSSAEEWIEYSPRLSLLDQGILNHPVRRCFASTALTIACFRLPTCIYCSNMATLRPHASFPAAPWEGAGRRAGF